MKVLAEQMKIESKLFLRDKGGLFWALAFPVFMIVLFGLIYQGEMWGEITSISYILPGIIVMAVMSTCVVITTSGVVSDREKGIFRRLSLTPLKRQTLIGGQITTRYIVVLVQTLVLITIAILAFGVTLGGNYLLFWGALTLGTLTFFAMGFALTTFIKSDKGVVPAAMAFLFVMMFLGGCFYPVDVMPEFLQPFCKALPSFHMNESLRMIAIEKAGIGTVWPEFLKMTGWLVVFSAIGVRFFKWE